MTFRRTIGIATAASLATAAGIALIVAAATTGAGAHSGTSGERTSAPVTLTAETEPTASAPIVAPTVTATAENPSGGEPATIVTSSAGVAAASSLPSGPIELATIACMAEAGYTWSNAIGIAIADAELEAARAAEEAGFAVGSRETVAAERAAAGTIVGLSAEGYPAYRVALTGDFANDGDACSARALAEREGTLGQDWTTFTAIERGCLSDRGFVLRENDDTRMADAVTDARLDWSAPDAIERADEIKAAVMGWDVEKLHAYGIALYGDAGSAGDYHWEDAGCSGYATHATANDHNN